MTDLTDDTRLAEIRKREEKATKGPWSIESCGEKGDGSNMIGVAFDSDDVNCERQMEGWLPLCRPISGEFIEYYRDELVAECEHQNRNSVHDSDFIAHARADVPWLLTQLDQRDAEIARLRGVIEAADRAIGDHNAPGDCYATGPLTGNRIADLVACPACTYVNEREALEQKP